MDFKTFRTIAASQFIFGNSQMTVPATQPVLFCGDQRKYFMFTGIHNLFCILNMCMLHREKYRGLSLVCQLKMQESEDKSQKIKYLNHEEHEEKTRYMMQDAESNASIYFLFFLRSLCLCGEHHNPKS